MLHAEINSACSSHDKEEKSKAGRRKLLGMGSRTKRQSFFFLSTNLQTHDLRFSFLYKCQKKLSSFFLKKEKRRK
jgi:hypothetical protein